MVFRGESTPKRLPKYLTESEILEILHEAKKHNRRNYLMLLILWRTGMRISDLVKLEKRDIREDTISIRLGKGKKDRVIPLDNDLNDIIGFYTDGFKPNEKLFHISDRQIRNIINRYAKPKGIYAFPHIFRHSFAVHCLKSGINLRSLQKILGHTNLNTTQVYLEIVGEDVIDDFKKVKFRNE